MGDIKWKDVQIVKVGFERGENLYYEGAVEDRYRVRLVNPENCELIEALCDIFGASDGQCHGLTYAPHEHTAAVSAYDILQCSCGQSLRVAIARGVDGGIVGTVDEVVFNVMGVHEKKQIVFPRQKPVRLTCYVGTKIALVDVEGYDGCEYDLRF